MVARHWCLFCCFLFAIYVGMRSTPLFDCMLCAGGRSNCAQIVALLNPYVFSTLLCKCHSNCCSISIWSVVARERICFCSHFTFALGCENQNDAIACRVDPCLSTTCHLLLFRVCHLRLVRIQSLSYCTPPVCDRTVIAHKWFLVPIHVVS